MIPRVVVQPQAYCDAQEIHAYLAKRSLATARRFNEAVADTILSIQGDPTIGILWQARNHRVEGIRWKRVSGFKKYLLFYCIAGDCVQVVRLLHGARDIESLIDGS